MLVPFVKWRLASENNAISEKKKQGAFIRAWAYIRIMTVISENRETSDGPVLLLSIFRNGRLIYTFQSETTSYL